MHATINGAEILSMRITMPSVGVWVLTAEVSSDEAITGAVTIEQDIDPQTFVGTVLRSGVDNVGVCRLEAVGGAGGLGQAVDARSYQGVTARAVLGDLLADAKEQLDSSSTRASLGTSLPYWTRAGGRASTALATLADALAARWRVLASGAVWVGLETWPKVPASYEATEIDRDFAAQNVLLAPEAFSLVPGVMLGDDRVGRVEHVLSQNAPLRTTYWIEAA